MDVSPSRRLYVPDAPLDGHPHGHRRMSIHDATQRARRKANVITAPSAAKRRKRTAMDNDQQRQNENEDQQGNNTVGEQQRFGDQVRNSPAGKKRKDRTEPQASLPTDRPLGDVRQGDPDWNGSW